MYSKDAVAGAIGLFFATATSMVLYQQLFYEEENSMESSCMLSPTNLKKKSPEGEKNNIRRNNSEYSIASDYSLGMSRSGSLADIVNLSRGVNSLGEFCAPGKIAIEIFKFFGGGIIVCGVIWKFLDATSPSRSSTNSK